MGDITGYVKDAETFEPISEATTQLIQSEIEIDSTITDSAGLYFLINVAYGYHKAQVTKESYSKAINNVAVNPAVVTEIDFDLDKAP